MNERHGDQSSESVNPVSMADQALYDGLDAAALTSEEWKAGYEAYQLAISADMSIDEAYWSALDAAASTKDLWKEGYLARKRSLDAAREADTIPFSQSSSERPATDVEYEPFLRTVSSFIELKSERRLSHELSEDVVTVDDARGLYGVYDGMGGNAGNPRAAAQAASDSIRRSLGDVRPVSKSDLMNYLKAAHFEANDDVIRNGEEGSTVATTVKIVEIDGRTYAGIAHAGDTRLFAYSKNTDTYFSVTEDQSVEHVVYNGFPTTPWSRSDQYEVIELQEGDRLMLCSDGITGDLPSEFLSEDDCLDAFRQRTTAACAQSFLRASKKIDDKSIIVVDVVANVS